MIKVIIVVFAVSVVYLVGLNLVAEAYPFTISGQQLGVNASAFSSSIQEVGFSDSASGAGGGLRWYGEKRFVTYENYKKEYAYVFSYIRIPTYLGNTKLNALNYSVFGLLGLFLVISILVKILKGGKKYEDVSQDIIVYPSSF